MAGRRRHIVAETLINGGAFTALHNISVATSAAHCGKVPDRMRASRPASVAYISYGQPRRRRAIEPRASRLALVAHQLHCFAVIIRRTYDVRIESDRTEPNPTRASSRINYIEPNEPSEYSYNEPNGTRTVKGYIREQFLTTPL